LLQGQKAAFFACGKQSQAEKTKGVHCFIGEDGDWQIPVIVKHINSIMDGTFRENGYIGKPLRKKSEAPGGANGGGKSMMQNVGSMNMSPSSMGGMGMGAGMGPVGGMGMGTMGGMAPIGGMAPLGGMGSMGSMGMSGGMGTTMGNGGGMGMSMGSMNGGMGRPMGSPTGSPPGMAAGMMNFSGFNSMGSNTNNPSTFNTIGSSTMSSSGPMTGGQPMGAGMGSPMMHSAPLGAMQGVTNTAEVQLGLQRIPFVFIGSG
jgi:hypothetical protein